MRKRDPRRSFLIRRRARARVSLVDQPRSNSDPSGGVSSKQVADVTLPRSELDSIWSPEYLERLARTYWRFLTRVSLGLLRVIYSDDSREIVFLRKPFVLLTFHAPEYEIAANRGSVTWRIKKGLLVSRIGRGQGFLRITVERPAEEHGALVTARVSSEVANFYPAIRGHGWFAKIGQFIYALTQMRIHVIVTNAFLRSLARLDLEPSVVGALTPAKLGEDAARATEPGPIAPPALPTTVVDRASG